MNEKIYIFVFFHGKTIEQVIFSYIASGKCMDGLVC